MNLNPLNNVSFGSNYRIDMNSKTDKVYNTLWKYDGLGVEVYEEYFDNKTSIERKTCGEYILNVEDKYDKKIETYLTQKGIDFRKTTKRELQKEENIKSRIKLDEAQKFMGLTLVEVNTKDFDKLFKETDEAFYINKFGTGGEEERYSKCVDYLLSGQELTPSTVVVNEIDGKLRIGFIDGRHRYSVLRDMKIEKIPVAMSKDSIEIAKKYNLI